HLVLINPETCVTISPVTLTLQNNIEVSTGESGAPPPQYLANIRYELFCQQPGVNLKAEKKICPMT
ncbi:MAG: hypothetical protein V3U06_13315, partial [Candidatus Binatia bacterium]